MHLPLLSSLILLLPLIYAQNASNSSSTSDGPDASDAVGPPGGATDIPPTVYDPTMTTGIDLSSIPNLPTRAAGSGTCVNSTCDPGSCTNCWESCGSCPVQGYTLYGCPNAKDWALTFDDGPSTATPVLLDTLKSLGLKATFCMLGGHAVQYADTVRRMFSEGHTICSHSWSHPHLMSLSTQQIIAEVVQTDRAIQGIIGVRPKYFRPPYGEFDARVLAVLRLFGKIPLLWNMDTLDYNILTNNHSPSRITAAVAAALKTPGTKKEDPFNTPGFVSLQHDTFLQSVQQENSIIDDLTSAGYNATSIPVCLGDALPYMDAQGRSVAAAVASPQGTAILSLSSANLGKS